MNPPTSQPTNVGSQDKKGKENPVGVMITISLELGIDPADPGCRESLGKILEFHRPYLSTIARKELPNDLCAKVSDSDLVQETFLKAQRDFEGFDGQSALELKAWLRQILLNSVAHAARHYRGTKKRTISRERSLDDGGSGKSFASQVPEVEPTPCTIVLRKEELSALAHVLAQLPERERQSLLWRHEEGCTFEEIGLRLGCSAVAARKTWQRATVRVRYRFTSSDD